MNHAQNIFGWRAEYVNSAQKGVIEAAMPIHRTPSTFILSYLFQVQVQVQIQKLKGE